MRRLIKNSIKPFVARAYTAQPIEGWPKWVGDLLGVKTPANVRPKAEQSPAGESNINIVFTLLDRTRTVFGDIAECGVYQGTSLAAISLYLKQNGLAKYVLGLDSFQGFDEAVKKDIGLGGADLSDKRVGGFNDTSVAAVRAKLASLGVLEVVTLVPGYFSDTLKTLPERRYSFVHLDCDIYESYKETIVYFYPRMSVGGVILFDEYNDPPWPGCNIAVDEFLADKPEKPVAISMNNYEKYFIQKCA